MKTLLKISQIDIAPEVNPVGQDSFNIRKAARAVVLDSINQVYLLNVTLHGYHKLPGGGIDKEEGIIQALERELLEEIGCKAEIVSELGEIIEYRDFEKLTQISYCYIARQVGEQQQSNLEESEIAEGMVELKAANVNEAIEILTADDPKNIEGKFIQKRDLAILEEAEKYLKRSS